GVAVCFVLIFFFQAEDGIRDLTVTGVQTCALPISHASGSGIRPPAFLDLAGVCRFRLHAPGLAAPEPGELPALLAVGVGFIEQRSEERRVGKECRSRGWQSNIKKNKTNKMKQRTNI